MSERKYDLNLFRKPTTPTEKKGLSLDVVNQKAEQLSGLTKYTEKALTLSNSRKNEQGVMTLTKCESRIQATIAESQQEQKLTQDESPAFRI